MKVAYVYPSDFAVWQVRRCIIKALIRCGHEVSVICPEGDYIDRIKKLGVNYIPIQIDRFINPIADIKFFFALFNIFRRERFDLVHNFTIKPNTYGAVAARIAGVRRRVSLVAGLGYAFVDSNDFKAIILKQIARFFYRIGFKCTDKVWFQNPDDLQYFVSEGLIPSEKSVLIKGSGVNIEEYSMDAVDSQTIFSLRSEFGIADSSPVVVMPARPTRSKGVPEFIAASKEVAHLYPEVIFLLMGLPATGDPGALSDDYLKSKENKNFRWLGFRRDAKEVLAIADIVTLPSYYREGIPRSLLEALALAKPIVTTDNVGCREAVENDKNGFMIPTKDVGALISSIISLLQNIDLRRQFGDYSRQKAIDEFNETRVIEQVFTHLYCLDSPYEGGGNVTKIS